MIFLLLTSVHTVLTVEIESEVAKQATSATNALAIPGVNSFLPMYEATGIIIAILISMIVHEFGHGIIARLHDVEANETGIGFLLILPIAAYVDIPEDKIMDEPPLKAIHILTAGIMNNIVLGIIAIIVMFVIGMNPVNITNEMLRLSVPNLGIIKSSLYWTAFMSLNLGVFNALPIGFLDGGRVVKVLQENNIVLDYTLRFLTASLIYLLILIFIV